MFHFVDSQSRQPADSLNDFLGSPFDTAGEGRDLIMRMPEWRQFVLPSGEDSTTFINARTALRVELVEVPK